ncbi:MAG: ATP-binding cassette domain-containing protein [Nitrospiraceae bacterium]|nr:ATP-binding cassette domain-containing protein [Nitrospiraceae bacterium]
MSDGTGENRLLLSLRDVSLSYWLKRGILRRKKHYALRGVSFELNAGDSLGIIGRNGSGKSTLLGLLAGTMTPDTGTVVRHGDIRASLLSLQLGFVQYLSGRENAILSGMFLGMTKHDVEQRLNIIAEFAELGDFMDQPLSSMRARLGFAVAFQLDPDILLIDEVLGVGDTAFREKAAQVMKERIQSQSSTVVFVSHSAHMVSSLCSRVLWLDRGRIVQNGPADAVIAAYEDALLSHEPIPRQGESPTPVEAPVFVRKKGTAKVFMLRDNTLLPIHSWEEFSGLGGRSADIRVLPEDKFKELKSSLSESG